MVPEEPAELQPLLLTEAQHVCPRDARIIELVLVHVPGVGEVGLVEELLHPLVVKLVHQRGFPRGIGHLLSQGAVEEVWPLRQEEDVERPGAREARPPASHAWPAKKRPELAEDAQQRGLADAAGPHDQAAVALVQGQVHVLQQQPQAVRRVDVDVLEDHAIGGLGRHEHPAGQHRDLVGAAVADGLRVDQGVDLLETRRLLRAGLGGLAAAAVLVEQEGLHDLVELRDACAEGAGLGKVDDLARDLVQGLEARDHGGVGEVEEPRPLRPVPGPEGDDAAQEHGDRELALVEDQLQDLHGELAPREGQELLHDGPEVAVEHDLLGLLAAVEADALGEGPAARVGPAEGGLRGLELGLGLAQAPAQALDPEEGREEEGRGQGGRQGALARRHGLDVQEHDEAARDEDEGLEDEARVRLHDAPQEELEEELHQQVHVVRHPLVRGVHAHVEVVQGVVQPPVLAEVHGLQPLVELRPPVDHQQHREVVRERLDRALDRAPDQDEGQQPLVAHRDPCVVPQRVELPRHARLHDALEINKYHGPGGEHQCGEHVEGDDKQQGPNLLVANQGQPPKAAERSQLRLGLGLLGVRREDEAVGVHVILARQLRALLYHHRCYVELVLPLALEQSLMRGYRIRQGEQ
mmetsp:Transcript_106332/g.300693  ORF Transcript_106332/g.300693 Transcript_106332/m.300693 type:complete len:637 (-) Transcript_106332:2815-4725(-)